MTPIHCPECSTEVPGAAHACPRCNFPVSKLRGLSAAILTRNADRVAGLIQLGADVNAADKSGRTPLITAVLMDDEEIVQMLLAAGAKPEFVNASGESALSIAKSRDVERLIRRAIVVSKLKRTQTAPIEDPPQTHKIEVQEKPAVEFDDSVMITEIPPPQFNHAMPIDVQLNEELFESLQSHKVHEEPLPELELDFDHSLRSTEVNAWENRPQSSFKPITPIQEVETIETEIPEEPLIKEEPAINFDNSFIYNPVLEWETRDDDSLWLQQTESEEKVVVEEYEQQQVAFVDDSPVHDSQQTIEIPEAFLPIKDDTNSSEVRFELPKSERPPYFIAAIFGCCLLIGFMALTWPHYYSAEPMPQPAQNPKPIKQATKITPAPPVTATKEIVPAEQPKVVEPISKPAIEVPKAVVQPNPKPEVKKKISIPVRKEKPKEDDDHKIQLARALNNQGYSLLKQGKHGEAIPVLERSVRAFPKGTKDVYYAYALFNLGVAWRKAGRPDLAIPILEERMKIADQRDIVARELSSARKEAKEEGFQE